MKTIFTRPYVVEHVIPDSPEEKKEIRRIIKEVGEEQGKIVLSEYKLHLPGKKD